MKDIAEKLNVKSQQVYNLFNTNIRKILSDDQMKILCQTPELARIISSGSITPISVEKKIEGRLCSKLIYKTTKGLRESYKILRQQVRIHNKDPKNKKGTKVTAKAVRKVTQAQTDTTKYRQHYTNLHILLEYGCRKEGGTLSLTGIGLLRVSPPLNLNLLFILIETSESYNSLIATV